MSRGDEFKLSPSENKKFFEEEILKDLRDVCLLLEQY